MRQIDDCGGRLETEAALSFRQGLVVFAILTATAALYYNVTRSYFCSYDDFIEVHRAAFVDAPNPKIVFTTTHFNSFKYRPLNRAFNLLSYAVGHGGPGAFRLRNLFFHLLNIAMVYLLATLLRKPIAVATTAALLFAVHPLANQAVIGAVMTNTAAHSMYLIAIIFFVLATQNRKREVLYVSLAGIFGVASLFTYDSNIVVFGAMTTYVLMLRFFLGKVVNKRLVIALATATVCSLGLYLGVRQLFAASAYHVAAESIVGPGLALRNTLTYLAALLQVLDPVLLNQWFGSPLPSEPNFFSGWHGMVIIACTVAAASAILVMVFMLGRRSRSADRWVTDAFLVVTAWLPVLPVVLLARHPSETSLYLPVALMTVVLVSLVYDLCPSRSAIVWLSVVCAVYLTLAFGSATWVRNWRVAACGAAAHKILTSISFQGLTDESSLGFFDAAYGRVAKPYGYYRFDGLNTVGEQSRDIQCAVQLVSGNNKIRASILDQEELGRIESGRQPSPYDLLIVVGADGNIAQEKIVAH
jgi:hypothetical protein